MSVEEQQVETSVATADPSEKDRAEHYFLDRLVLNIGNAIAWIFPLLMVAICAQVILRKNGHNQAWLDDGQWWLYGFAMITGFGYAITTNSHVRVDIFHQRFSTSARARLEVFALGWLLLPFIAIMVDILSQYAWSSWTAREGSDSPNGLHRLYLLKIAMPILLTLAALAAWSMIRRSLNRFTTPSPFKMILAALPFCVFALDRIDYQFFYLYIKLSQPDLKTRQIPKDPLMQYTTITAVSIIALVMLALLLKRKTRSR